MKKMPEDRYAVQTVDTLVTLLKRGDSNSLTRLRNLLDIKRSQLALEIGVSEQTLEFWEGGKEQPPHSSYSSWKIKLSSHLNSRIATYLGTENGEVIHKYWALIWELVE
jgi:DNA-binding XRE family transcriptional regulator